MLWEAGLRFIIAWYFAIGLQNTSEETGKGLLGASALWPIVTEDAVEVVVFEPFDKCTRLGPQNQTMRISWLHELWDAIADNLEDRPTWVRQTIPLDFHHAHKSTNNLSRC